MKSPLYLKRLRLSLFLFNSLREAYRRIVHVLPAKAGTKKLPETQSWMIGDLKLDLPNTESGLNYSYILSSKIYNAYLSLMGFTVNAFVRESIDKLQLN